jgi:hypothetical protein
MRWTPVESSVFWAAGYAEDQSWLYLLFRSGEVYRYFDVPRRQYEELLGAASKGRYFGRHMRGRFRYERVRRSR